MCCIDTRDRHAEMFLLNVYAFLDPLRIAPRFQDLLRRGNTPMP